MWKGRARMAHQAIYRKWRPMTFDDIVGQNHITKTLKNQILSGTVGHAYLFCGTRGTGKTTCAKVLSRAVNCLHPVNGNPCNECEVCRGIIDGSIMDVTEMDAASNNGVEDIRDIKEDINYVASNAKYTVYIIDEVHMLSTSAFNALLKTLEEPPENVIFILATTEAHKVPQTILSRCQRFDFRRIRNEDIIVRMKEIATADGYNITDDAYRMLAQLADGSLRDGLSVMERVISASGSAVSAEDIVNTLGISTQDSVFELTDAIINGDSAAVIACIDRTLAEGKDLTQLANTMLSHFRALMICKLSDNPEKLLDYDPQSLVRLKAQSGRMTFEKINHASTLISTAISDARLAKSARIIYELAFIKLTKPEIDRTPQGLMDRLAQLEQKMELGAAPRQTEIPQSAGADNSEILNRLSAIERALQNGAAAEPAEQPKPQPEKKKVSHRLYNPIPKDELNFDYPTAKLARNWRSTVETMKQKGAAYVMPLTNCTVTFDADSLIIVVPEGRQGFTFKMAVSHIDAIRENFRKVTGSPYNIKIVNRADLDDEQIINPFDLPHIEGAAEKYNEEPDQQIQETEKTDADKFDEFIAKFAGIITDGDRILPGEDAKLDTGVQSSIDEIE
ncbi:MAG: DNA polymerase III subunit gamma/tau, partial [Candidatus Ornithomonoglobus sp.]